MLPSSVQMVFVSTLTSCVSLQLHSVMLAGGSSSLYTLSSSSLSKWELGDSWEHQVLNWDAQKALTESIADAIWVSTSMHQNIHSVIESHTELEEAFRSLLLEKSPWSPACASISGSMYF